MDAKRSPARSATPPMLVDVSWALHRPPRAPPCSICVGLDSLHDEHSCVLRRSALHCSCLAPLVRPCEDMRCTRDLLSMLACLHLYDWRLGAPLDDRAAMADQLDKWKTFAWGDALRPAAQLAASVVLVGGVPWPAQLKASEPFACEFVPAQTEGVFLSRLLPSLPLRAAQLTLVSKNWVSLLQDVVLQGRVDWLLEGSLVPLTLVPAGSRVGHQAVLGKVSECGKSSFDIWISNEKTAQT
jgi:hypothetical protein